MPDAVTYPVQVLREHTVALEAALSVCLAHPTHKPVHRLRTETRRIEAQLLLLAELPEMPKHRTEADRLRKSLRRLRRAAGVVRDLDVQRRRLEWIAASSHDAAKDVEAAADSATAAAAGRPGKKAPRAPKTFKKIEVNVEQENSVTLAEPSSKPAQAALAAGATELRDRLKARRDAAAGDLQMLLKKRQTRIAERAETLLKTLKSAADLALPAVELQRYAGAALLREGSFAQASIKGMGKNELHSARKAAKAARYLAETLPQDAAAVTAAQQFQNLQDSGGKWHDALDLARIARRFLGKRHELTVAIAGERERNLETYREMLAAAGPAAERSPQESSKKTVSSAPGKRPKAASAAA